MSAFSCRSPKRLDGDAGYVTAETAIVLPALAIVVAAALWAIAVAGAQLRCVDAARDGARAAARGESESAVMVAARATAPQGASIDIARNGSQIVVTVKVRVGPASGVLASIPSPVVRASAVAESEAERSSEAQPLSEAEP
jgi:hypothetical protein